MFEFLFCIFTMLVQKLQSPESILKWQSGYVFQNNGIYYIFAKINKEINKEARSKLLLPTAPCPEDLLLLFPVPFFSTISIMMPFPPPPHKSRGATENLYERQSGFSYLATWLSSVLVSPQEWSRY